MFASCLRWAPTPIYEAEPTAALRMEQSQRGPAIRRFVANHDAPWTANRHRDPFHHGRLGGIDL